MFSERTDRKSIRILGMVVAVLLAIVALSIQPSRSLAAADATWQARYWNNKNMTGDPVLERQEADVNYNWGQSAPAPGVNADNFSVRWRKIVNVTDGTYRFTATMDDGMRVWVDDALIMDSWYDSQEHSLSATIALSGGDHRIKVEYYDAGGAATAKMRMEAVSVSISRWRGEYFNNLTMTGAPVMVRDDEQIDFDWGGGSPAWNVVASDNFSVRWTRDIVLDPGRYRFTTETDDGVRLWVNNRLLIDRWYDQAAMPYSAEIDLPGGTIPIRMEYYERAGGAVAHLNRTKLAGVDTITQWRGEYYNNMSLSGTPALVRDDAYIDFRWDNGSPAANINADNFSVRWTRTLYFTPGRYRFTANTDDGVRVWVNGQLIINAWNDHRAQDFVAEIDLPAGNVSMKVEYYDNGGLASARLTRTQVSTPAPTPLPITTATATVTGYRLNVRQGPGLDQVILTQVSRGEVLTLAGYRTASSTWIKVILSNGTQGWVFAGLLQSSYPFANLIVGDGPSAAPAPAPAPSGATARVNAYHLNVRQGPGISYVIISVLNRNQVVSLAGVRNSGADWVKIILPNGSQGWVSAAYVTTSVPVSSLPVGTP